MIIIMQSLYSYLRTMPLWDRLEELLGREEYLCWKTEVLIDDESKFVQEEPRTFDDHESTKFYEFSMAETSLGIFKVSVTYSTLDSMAIQAGIPLMVTDPVNIREIPTTPSAEPRGMVMRQATSPIPSPTTRRKVLSVIERRFRKEPRHGLSVGALFSDDTMHVDEDDAEKGDGKAEEQLIQRSPESRRSTSMLTSSVASKISRSPNATLYSGSDIEDEYRASRETPISLSWDDSMISSSADLLLKSSKGSLPTTSSDFFGSFVGSYEESILNGRMSTLPSRPIEFLSEIGVFGRGGCRAALKCPPHVTIPFAAYFYEVEDTESPSPYVGDIDLPAGLLDRKKHVGMYRIPSKGQLQIIIKNPNKTVVKIFLVAYDVSDMPCSSKTFLRQMSHGTMRPAGLRYAIQVNLMCDQHGRIFLHRNVRVVFSHRLPDTDEKLKITTYWPQNPKYVSEPPHMLSSQVQDVSRISDRFIAFAKLNDAENDPSLGGDEKRASTQNPSLYEEPFSSDHGTLHPLDE